MIINLLDVSLIVDIKNERITKYLFDKLSHFEDLSPQIAYYLLEVNESFFNDKSCEIYGNSKIKLDMEQRCLWFYYSERDEKLYIELIILQYILYILVENEIYYLHGACVTSLGCNKQGILLLGQSGSGKSSLALKMIENGERIASDDFLLFKKNQDGYYVYMNKTTPHIHHSNLIENFEKYVTHSQETSYKTKVLIEDIYTKVYEKNILPQYLFILHNENQKESSISRSDDYDVMRYILKNMCILQHYSYRKYFDFAINIAKQCFAYSFQLNKDIENNVDIIYSVIKNRGGSL